MAPASVTFDIDDNVFLLPGPVKIHQRVMRAQQRGALAHRSPEFQKVIRRIDSGLKVLFSTKKSSVAAMTASATGVMEAAVSNLARPDGRFVALHNGKFGERFRDLVVRWAGQQAVDIGSPYAQPLDLDRLQRELEVGDVHAVAMVINESSTGMKNPVEQVARLCQEHGALLVADGVTAFGAMEVSTDRWGIDVAICGSQKAIGAPPGVGFVAVSERAEKRIQSPSLYLDLKLHLEKWREASTPFTPATHGFLACAEALDMMVEEGIRTRIERNRRLATAFRTSMDRLGLRMLPPKGAESDTVSAVVNPEGVEEAQLRGRLKSEWGIVVAGGQNELKGRIFRVATMGHVRRRELAAAVVAIESCLAGVVRRVPTGAAVGAFSDAATPGA